jgi:hypothetical protein
VGPSTEVYLHITASGRHDQAVLEAQEKASPGAELHVSLRTSADDAPVLAARVADALPGVTVQVER